MTTNPLTQFLLCALAVFLVWALCGPLLRRLSKPKALPKLEDLMAADADHAEREAYTLRRRIERDTAEAEMYETRFADLTAQVRTRRHPQPPPIPTQRYENHNDARAAGAIDDTQGYEGTGRLGLEKATGEALDVWGGALNFKRKFRQSDDDYRCSLLALHDALWNKD